MERTDVKFPTCASASVHRKKSILSDRKFITYRPPGNAQKAKSIRKNLSRLGRTEIMKSLYVQGTKGILAGRATYRHYSDRAISQPTASTPRSHGSCTALQHKFRQNLQNNWCGRGESFFTAKITAKSVKPAPRSAL